MGSEMCIRDSLYGERFFAGLGCPRLLEHDLRKTNDETPFYARTCLLYTSDAADERSSVDLGGRRIIKKKTKVEARGRPRLGR